jgi:transmembrane sensor
MRYSDSKPHSRTALQKEAQHWLLRLTSGTATAYDARAFKSWCGQSPAHVEAFADMRRLWENLGPAAASFTARQQEDVAIATAPAAPLHAPSGPRMQPRRMSRRAFIGGAVAASAAAVMVMRPPLNLWPSLTDMVADYHTATGEQKDIELGSDRVLHMNTQTTVNLRKQAGRVVGLELVAGEIQVRNSDTALPSFTVYAGDGRIQIDGQTRCNIRCIGADIQVTGLDGTSTLQYQGRQTVLHTAQRADYGDGRIGPVVAADLEATMAWRRRVLIFDGRPLAEVIEEINRYRPGKIILTNPQLAARKVQARISLNQLADIAALIHDEYGAKIDDLPGGIMILS